MSRTKEDIVAYLLFKSGQDLSSAKSLANVQSWDGVINRLYYAAFHCVSALLYQNDMVAKSHSGIKSLLELHFVKTGLLSIEWGKFYARLFSDRSESDYEDFAIITAEDVLPLVPQTEEFIDVIKRLINP